SAGGSLWVSVTTRSVTLGPSGWMREGRVLSRRRPSYPSCMKRSCQRQTQVFDFPVRRMISLVPIPSALNSTISARQTCLCGALRSRASAFRRRRSEGLRVMEIPVRMRQTRMHTVRWEGTAEWLSSRFARVRVRIAHRDYNLTEARPEEWLLIEWPEGEDEPTKYWLSTLPKDVSFRRLVDTAKLRWRIERDYQELKQEVGLGHFEGRGWRGFHHHATLCIAAYGFLVLQRC